MLAPKNGRSYNQLALLAMYQNRRLDAVYYYMRSLAASNPFLTARENLLAIFDEVRRKVSILLEIYFYNQILCLIFNYSHVFFLLF
jgi:protein SMG6